MLNHRVQPAEKKSQRNAERHFRFPVYAFAKDDGNLTYAQRSPSAQHCFENNFEAASLWREFQQPGTTDGKEAAHRIVQVSEWIGERCPCSGHNPAPHWPAWCRSAFYIATADHKVCGAGKQWRHQTLDPVGGCPKLCIS